MVVLIYLLVSYLCFALAAFCNSVMDTLDHHFINSIFNSTKLDDKFWNPSISHWTTPYLPYTKYKLDAWHLFKSLMIIFHALSNCFIFLAGTYITNLYSEILSIFILLIVYGIIWNVPFNLFYNRILITKK